MNKHRALLLLSAQYLQYCKMEQHSNGRLFLDNHDTAVLLTDVQLSFIRFWSHFCFKDSIFSPFIGFVLFCPFPSATLFCCPILHCLHENKTALDLDVKSIWPDKNREETQPGSSLGTHSYYWYEKAINTHYKWGLSSYLSFLTQSVLFWTLSETLSVISQS